MKKVIDSWGTPGDLLHAVLNGWIVVEISEASDPDSQNESRRRQGSPKP